MSYINLEYYGKKRTEQEQRIAELIQIALNGNNHSTPKQKEEAQRKLLKLGTKVYSKEEIKRYEQGKRGD